MSSADSGLTIKLIKIALTWALVFGALWLILALYRQLDARLKNWVREMALDQASRAARLKLIFASRVRGLVSWVFKIGAFLWFLLMTSAALTFTLAQFGATAHLANSWIDWIKDPVRAIWAAFVDYLPSLGFLIVWGFIIYWAIRLLRGVSRWVEEGLIVIPGFHADWAEPTYRILAFLTVAFGLVVAFPYLPGGRTPAFQGVSIFIGVLISVGSGSAMGNVISGILLTYTRSFRIGDRIRIGDQTGDVIERSMFVTRIRTIKNEEIFIPNSTVMASPIVNYTEGTHAGGLILYTTITIGYDAPWRQVHQLMVEAAMRTDGIVKEPAPFVLQTALNDYNVSYQINAYTNRPQDMPNIYSDLHRHLQDTFNEAGVEIMSPAYHSLRDGNQVTIPPDYLPSDYRPPGFRVQS
jgi:small-conductance mechanosensitive channel